MKKTAIILGTIELSIVMLALFAFLGIGQQKTDDEVEIQNVTIEETYEEQSINYEQTMEDLNMQYEEEINELNDKLLESLYREQQLQDKIDVYENRINELEKQLEEQQNNVEYENITYENYVSGNDSDNDGDDQYDNEYADPDRVWIDENGIIIYDEHGHYDNYQKESNNISSSGNYYIAPGNSYYHNSSNCKFLEGADTERVTEGQAISRGKHMCNCIKY